MFLTGDIGGTKTDLAIYSAENDFQKPIAEARYQSADHESLAEIARDFLEKNPSRKVRAATFAVAGPVADGKAHITNLPWEMSEESLAESLTIKSVHLVNDLESIAWAVPALGADDLETLNVGQRAERAPLAVLAPGTGLGQAYLTWSGDHFHAHASEGGHADFAPGNSLETELLAHMQKKCDHVSYERVCSGLGFPNLYDFLRDKGVAPELPEMRDALAAAKDRTPIIMEAALDKSHPCKLAKETLKLFVEILGSAAGNLVFHYMATGGIYLGGGIPPRILPALKSDTFLRAFENKGRLSGVVRDTPVHVITGRVSLLGAALYTRAHSQHS